MLYVYSITLSICLSAVEKIFNFIRFNAEGRGKTSFSREDFPISRLFELSKGRFLFMLKLLQKELQDYSSGQLSECGRLFHPILLNSCFGQE
jgi:hypothetical protein